MGTSLNQLSRYGTSTIYEAAGRHCDLPMEIKPIANDMKVSGPAFTVICGAADNLALHRALEVAPDGAVLVVSPKGDTECSYAGGLIAVAARSRRLAGMVINGCVRDIEEITSSGLPTFARGVCHRGAGKQDPGDLQLAVTIGERKIDPGDLIFGDQDGVVLVRPSEFAAVAAAASARDMRERRLQAGIAAGRTTIELLELNW